MEKYGMMEYWNVGILGLGWMVLNIIMINEINQSWWSCKKSEFGS
jgi:hypothetical protein